MDVKLLINSPLFILCFLSACILPCNSSKSKNDYLVEDTNFMFIQIKDEHDLEYVTRELSAKNLHLLSRISSLLYLFQDKNYHVNREAISKSFRDNNVLTSKVVRHDQARAFMFKLSPERVPAQALAYTYQWQAPQILKCQTYFDMGVEHAWKEGYTGKGIVVAVNDVGINKDIPDLTNNLLIGRSYDYIYDTRNVAPDTCGFDGYFNPLQDHGNRCAGVIAAEKNEQCGTGIGYDAKIIAVKCFGLVFEKDKCYLKMADHSTARALTHALDEVDVYSNSWGSLVNFIPVHTGVSEAIKTGIEEGRDGKGAIYVFPVGKLADPYANSIYTIAVNGVGKDGKIPLFSETCACTLTSAYGEGSKLRSLVTTSNLVGRHCTLEFEGVSASTAIVSGIMTLVLQANSKLGWREVQHLVVESSDRQGLHMDVYNSFVKNGAGRMYHPQLGFGLLNASKIVERARSMEPLPKQLHAITNELFPRRHGSYDMVTHQRAVTRIHCSSTCITAVEHVVVHVDFRSLRESDTELKLVSPSGTVSLLMKRLQSKKSSRTERTGIVFSSVNFWGERSYGRWVLEMKQYGGNRQRGDFEIKDFKLSVYGTGYTQQISQETPMYTEKTFTPLKVTERPRENRPRENKPRACMTGAGPSVSIVVCCLLLFLLLLLNF